MSNVKAKELESYSRDEAAAACGFEKPSEVLCGDKSNTPRTDAEAFDGGGSGLNTPNPQGMLVRADVARQLERELEQAHRNTARVMAHATMAATPSSIESVTEGGSPCPHEREQQLDGRCSACDCGKPSHVECCRFVASMLRGPLQQPALADRVEELIAETKARSASALISVLEQTGVGMLAQTNIEDGHSWVRRAPTGDKPLDEIEWCQWCGTHKAEVSDWMDNPQCAGFKAVREQFDISSAVEKRSPTQNGDSK